METVHDVIDAGDHYSISGVLEEHLKRPLCRKDNHTKRLMQMRAQNKGLFINRGLFFWCGDEDEEAD